MQIINVEHPDFSLSIDTKDIKSLFDKAEKKQEDIHNATSYSANEGRIRFFNVRTLEMEPLQAGKTHPLIFENHDYFFGITFLNKDIVRKPAIYSKIKEVEDKFFYREDLGFLSGTVNFHNDLGKSELILRYTKEDVRKEFIFCFEVFPTKLDFRHDYDRMVADIEKEYAYLVLDFLKSTYASFITGDSPNTDLIWWQVFGGLYREFMDASAFILNRPRSRIITESNYVNADRIVRWTPSLEEDLARFRYFPEKKYRTERKILSTDTSENRFFKYAVGQTAQKFSRIKTLILTKYQKQLSDSFKEELTAIEKELQKISAHPFFRTIGDFKGIRQESLVLQKASGYSTVYRCWIMLHSGLKLFDGVQKIELKNIAELYQIWCFLEIKKVLQDLLGKDPDEIDLAEIRIDDFIFRIERGLKSKVLFIDKNGNDIELFHDFPFNKVVNGNVRSFTVNQRPDIVLRISKNDLRDRYILTYLYDAKYRLQSDEDPDAPDLPPEDAINQMHRYRDAIYYVNKDRPEKEIIGAYVLFPGNGNLEQIRKMDYLGSIDKVNIGAFPLRPNDHENRKLLENHLSLILDKDTDHILNDVSPQKGSIYEASNPCVLIGFVPTDAHAACFERTKDPFYYSGEKKPTRFGFNALKYFSPYIKGKGIREYFEIISYDIIQRNLIEDAPAFKPFDRSERLVIWLGKRHSIAEGRYVKLKDGSIGYPSYRYTNLKNIRNPQDWKILTLNDKQ